MLTKHVLKIFQKSLVVAALALALSACGKQDSTVLTPWGNNTNGTCPSGYQFIAGYGCWYQGGGGGGSFYITSSACTSRQLSATQVELACPVTSSSYLGSSSSVPYLPNAASISQAWVGPEVKLGDQVTLQGSMRYGAVYLGSIFGDCKDEQDASPILKGAVGSSFFNLPLGSQVTMQAAGTLRFGMSELKSCYEASNVYVRIIRNQ